MENNYFEIIDDNGKIKTNIPNFETAKQELLTLKEKMYDFEGIVKIVEVHDEDWNYRFMTKKLKVENNIEIHRQQAEMIAYAIKRGCVKGSYGLLRWEIRYKHDDWEEIDNHAIIADAIIRGDMSGKCPTWQLYTEKLSS